MQRSKFRSCLRHTARAANVTARAAECLYAGKGRPAKIDVIKVREMKEQGRGATEIAEQMGIGQASVYRVLGEAP